MRPIEFYTTPEGDISLRPLGEAERLLTENDTEFIQKFLSVVSKFYPAAYEALMELYGSNDDKEYRDYLAVRRFLKCNFGVYDNMIDIDADWNFKFEFVSCPLRGECKFDRVICSPVFNSKLSERELEVMKLLFAGVKDSVVADKLFISINTVNNHRKNVLKKLDMHSMKDFIKYAIKNNLFNNN